MNKEQKEAMRQRFTQAYEWLEKAKILTGQSQLAAALSWNQTTISTVLNGGRPLPMDRAIAFCDKYNVSQEWLLRGKGKMFSGDETPALVTHSSSDLEKENIRLRESLTEKIRTIEMMAKVIELQEDTLEEKDNKIIRLKKELSQTMAHRKRPN